MPPKTAAAPRTRATLLPALAGFALALPFLFLFSKHPDGGFDLLSLLLAFTGGIYFGAALRGGSRRRVAFEGVAGWVLVLMGFLSLAWSPLWMALGFALHGAWSLAHHTGAIKHGVRQWFPPLYAAWEWAMAAIIVYYTYY